MTVFFGLPLWLWVLAGVGLLAAAAYFIRDWVRQMRARKAIDNVISSVAYDELRNALLPTGTGDQIHVHYLLLTQNGLLVIDLFDVQGVIFAGEKMAQWSVFGPKRHFTFTNPLPMLEDRVLAVKQLAGETPVQGRIVSSRWRTANGSKWSATARRRDARRSTRRPARSSTISASPPSRNCLRSPSSIRPTSWRCPMPQPRPPKRHSRSRARFSRPTTAPPQPSLALQQIAEEQPHHRHKSSTDEVFSEPQRLHKILASCGFGSRRAMEELILAGRITVNRMPAEIGQKVGPGDEVRINGEPVKIRFAEPKPLLEFSGLYDEALAAYRGLLSLHSEYPAARACRARVKVLQGKAESALRESGQEADPFWRRYSEILALAAAERPGEAGPLLDRMIGEDGAIDAFQIAEILAFQGEVEHAFDWLGRARRQRDPGLSALLGNPLLGALHDDPRWTALLESLGLPLDSPR